MSTRHSKQNLGFRTETTAGTSEIELTSPAGNEGPYYYFGGITRTPGHMPTFDKTSVPYYTSGIEADEIVLVDRKVSQTLAFTMTNGLMPFFLYGDVSHSTGVFTLAFHKFPPPFTFRWESGYSGNYTIKEVVNCKITSAVINWDFTADYNPVTMGINIEGLEYKTTANDTNQGDPIYPVSAGQTMDPPFFKDKVATGSGQVIDWDAGDGTDDWTDSLLKCTLTTERTHKRTKFAPDTKATYFHSGKANHVVTFVVHRNADTAFLADFEADSQLDLRIKLFSTATLYMDYDMTEISLSQAKPNFAIIEDNEVPTYECVGTVKTVAPVFKDGVTNGAPFYVDQ